ncbi:MAG: hypothetical protein E6Q78_02285 [Rhodoferax sp.]|nr:MAG: hypothetical protein E6Q78_02285 [Rhodoferax sp.]
MSTQSDYATRKALLVQRCDLERLRLQRALGQARAQLRQPLTEAQPSPWTAPFTATLLSLALPQLGVQRLQNLVALLKVALTGYRAWRLWQAAAQSTSAETTSPPQ